MNDPKDTGLFEKVRVLKSQGSDYDRMRKILLLMP